MVKFEICRMRIQNRSNKISLGREESGANNDRAHLLLAVETSLQDLGSTVQGVVGIICFIVQDVLIGKRCFGHRHTLTWNSNFCFSKYFSFFLGNKEIVLDVEEDSVLTLVWNNNKFKICFYIVLRYIQLQHLPVSILSLTMQFPIMSTASQCIWQPREGITMTSPGTRCDVGTSSYSSGPRFTVTTSEECTVRCRFFWFCLNKALLNCQLVNEFC